MDISGIEKKVNKTQIPNSASSSVSAPFKEDDFLFEEDKIQNDDVDIVQINNTGGVQAPGTSTSAAQTGKISEAEAIKQGYTCIKSGEELMEFITRNPAGKFMLMCDIDFSTFDFQTMGQSLSSAF